MHASLANANQHTLPAFRLRGRNTRARLASHGGDPENGKSLFSLDEGFSNFPMDRFAPSSPAKERGAALIFALVMLLLLTILGITAVTTSSLQEKMAGNMRDQYMAQQAADSILRDAEALIFNQAQRPTPSCPANTAITQRVWDSASVGLPGCLTDVTAAADSWWTANGFASTLSNGKTAQEPRYVVEYIQRVPVCLDCKPKIYRYYYRTTGWSVGATDYARGLIQSVFTKKTDDYLP